MMSESRNNRERRLFDTLVEMLNPKHPLYKLANEINWTSFESEFKRFYSHTGRPSKTVRLMVSLHMLKHMYDLGDETVIEQWVQNPYFQYFSGEERFQWTIPCDPSDLVHFRKRIGEQGAQKILAMTISLHKDAAKEKVIVADTTVQEKNITFPTDVKLYRKVISRCWKIADGENIVLRQRYTRVVKRLLLLQRFRNHPKNYKTAIKAQRKVRTIAGRLHREIIRKLPDRQFAQYAYDLDVCGTILYQKRTDKNKVYSLHEPDVYCISKGKEHKQYEFGCKVSLLKTKDSGIIVGALSFKENDFDGHTLEPALKQYKELLHQDPDEVIVDRGYKGKSLIGTTRVLLPKLNKNLTPNELRKLKLKFRRRAAIEPIIGHLKTDNKLGRNYLKGIIGDAINVMLAAAGFNLRKWMRKVLFVLGKIRSFLSSLTDYRYLIFLKVSF